MMDSVIEKHSMKKEEIKAAQIEKRKSPDWKIDLTSCCNNALVGTANEIRTVDLTTGRSISIDDVIQGQQETNEVIIHKYNIPVTRKDLCTLKDGRWLNDEIVNFYMALLNDRDEVLYNRSRQDPSLPTTHQKSYFANSFFFQQLLVQGIYLRQCCEMEKSYRCVFDETIIVSNQYKQLPLDAVGNLHGVEGDSLL